MISFFYKAYVRPDGWNAMTVVCYLKNLYPVLSYYVYLSNRVTPVRVFYMIYATTVFVSLELTSPIAIVCHAANFNF